MGSQTSGQRQSVPVEGIARREVLRRGLLGMGILASGPQLYACGGKEPTERLSNLANLGPLRGADANGVRLPEGFTSRILARSGEAPLASSSYVWHQWPDGGATFALDDGGWIYVSNAELNLPNGGVGALRFADDGTLVDAYPILRETSRNCAGGPTPWGTWLSCEEIRQGVVWECDPTGREAPEVRMALGVFNHEAVAVDPVNEVLFLTEDEVDGRFYRFVPDNVSPDGRFDLDNGVLEVAHVIGEEPEGPIEWHPVPDPLFTGDTPTRMQVEESTAFAGGEGIWYSNGFVYFATKFDNRVWAYEIETSLVSILYDVRTSENPILSGVDNVTVSEQGDVLVAEDGGDLQIVGLAPTGEIVALMQLVDHPQSEIAGPAFDPSGSRLYFSSQRGPGAPATGGITYEITGPFFV